MTYRDELLAAAGALGMRNCWLQVLVEVDVVRCREVVQEFLCHWVSTNLMPSGRMGELTNHIVAKVVLDQSNQTTLTLASPLIRSNQDIDNVPSPEVVRVLDTLLDHVARELVLAVAFQSL